MSIRTMWRSLIDEIEAGANLKAAELRHGLTLIEAAALDQTRAELATVVGTVNVDSYLQEAVEMGKLGILPGDLETWARVYYRARNLGLDDNDTYMRLLRTEAEREGPDAPDEAFDQFVEWLHENDPKEKP